MLFLMEVITKLYVIEEIQALIKLIMVVEMRYQLKIPLIMKEIAEKGFQIHKILVIIEAPLIIQLLTT